MRHIVLTRREVVRDLLAGAAFTALGCAVGESQEPGGGRSGRLAARPRPVQPEALAGRIPLGLGRERDGFLHIPAGVVPSTPGPLILMLHGAGGSASGILSRLAPFADEVRCPMLVPDSRGPTWDAIRGDFGPDVRFIDAALDLAFSRLTIDPGRVVVSGFSDGASYALALGVVNGDLFRRVMAFSPGFVPPGRATGKPAVFITHGDQDPILPLEVTSRRIVATLSRAGYDVTLREFAGGHTVPSELAREAFTWAAHDAAGGVR